MVGKSGGVGVAGDVGAAGGIDRDPVALVVAASAEVGRVDEARAVRSELAHEGVAEMEAVDVVIEGGLEGAGRGREVRRVGGPGDVGAAGGIDRDPEAEVS